LTSTFAPCIDGSNEIGARTDCRNQVRKMSNTYELHIVQYHIYMSMSSVGERRI